MEEFFKTKLDLDSMLFICILAPTICDSKAGRCLLRHGLGMAWLWYLSLLLSALLCMSSTARCMGRARSKTNTVII